MALLRGCFDIVVSSLESRLSIPYTRTEFELKIAGIYFLCFWN